MIALRGPMTQNPLCVRRPTWVLTAFLVLASLCLLCCSRVVERKGDVSATDPGEPGSADEGRIATQQRQNYIRATVEIACIGGREDDPNKIVRATLAVYRQYGFNDVMAYLALVKPLGQDKAAQAQIARGIDKCL